MIAQAINDKFFLRYAHFLYNGYNIKSNYLQISLQSQETQQQQQTQPLLSSEYDNLIFSAQYYATTYPDLVTLFGYDAQALHNHFMID